MRNKRVTSRADSGEEKVFLSITKAAALIDLTPGALRKKLVRVPPPPGVLIRWGRSLFVHRDKFLAWLEQSDNG